jgi:uncharacterized membrane protein
MARRFRPYHALALVLLFLAGGLAAERFLSGPRSRFERVAPDPRGEVTIDLAGFSPQEVRFYRFLNSGNQEVRFLVGRDERGAFQVAFDASDSDYKMKRGFRAGDGWVVNNKCDSSFRLTEVNAHPSPCAPVPLHHRILGERLLLTEADILEGWRYFR